MTTNAPRRCVPTGRTRADNAPSIVILSDHHLRALDIASSRRNLVMGWGANGIRALIGARR